MKDRFNFRSLRLQTTIALLVMFGAVLAAIAPNYLRSAGAPLVPKSQARTKGPPVALGAKIAAGPSVRGPADNGRSALYAVQEHTTGELVYREFAAADGTVFGVAWDGPTRPDLSTLLGSWFEHYNANRAFAPDRRRQTLRTSTEQLDVVSGGRPGHFFGRAVVRELLPPGVSVEDVK